MPPTTFGMSRNDLLARRPRVGGGDVAEADYGDGGFFRGELGEEIRLVVVHVRCGCGAGRGP
jgi:hypothetical protein